MTKTIGSRASRVGSAWDARRGRIDRPGGARAGPIDPGNDVRAVLRHERATHAGRRFETEGTAESGCRSRAHTDVCELGRAPHAVELKVRVRSILDRQAQWPWFMEPGG